MNYRNLKNLIKTILLDTPPEQACKMLKDYRFNQVKGPLKGLLFEPDTLIRFRASELMGILAQNHTQENIEKVRDLMRQLMWNLNEESGGIGWGCVEAMAEIAVRNNKIFNEFFKIIIAYSDPESTSFLDHEDLHPGASWAVGKILKIQPEKGHYAKNVLMFFLNHKNSTVNGNGLWAISNLPPDSDYERSIKNFIDDTRTFNLYEDSQLKTISISELAQKIFYQESNT